MGQIKLQANVEGRTHIVALSEVYYAKDLTHSLPSYCKLEEKGVALIYEEIRRYLKRTSDGARVFAVGKENNVLIVCTQCDAAIPKRNEVIYAALHAADTDSEIGVSVKCTLLDLHKRLGHLMYDTVERMSDSEGSGIELIDRKRPSCITCAHGKQGQNAQSKKDIGTHFPIDRIGGVICSDLKGPTTPTDRCGNRYMINFVDHASNYCRVFVARKKDQAPKMFEHFLVFFERTFDCKVHILRTDGGGE